MAVNQYHALARNGKLAGLPLTKTDILATDRFGGTVLVYAAAHGFLNQVDSSLVTKETLLARNTAVNGMSALYAAAMNGHLDQIPEDLLTIENLTSKDNNGLTPLHVAARYGFLGQVPVDRLTKEAMLVQASNPAGLTPLAAAYYANKLTEVPFEALELCKKETLGATLKTVGELASAAFSKKSPEVE